MKTTFFACCHFTMGNNMEAYEYDSFRMHESINGETQYSPYCHVRNSLILLDLETSRQILHAMPIRCTKQINFERVIFDLTPYHLNLTKKGYRAFIYCGDHDMVLPYTATLQWIRSLNYSAIAKWHPWLVDDQIAGYVFLPSYKCHAIGAGHTAAEYMPREALAAYQRWIDGADSL
ncbi:unnamed protein product [Musa textilis]